MPTQALDDFKPVQKDSMKEVTKHLKPEHLAKTQEVPRASPRGAPPAVSLKKVQKDFLAPGKPQVKFHGATAADRYRPKTGQQRRRAKYEAECDGFLAKGNPNLSASIKECLQDEEAREVRDHKVLDLNGHYVQRKHIGFRLLLLLRGVQLCIRERRISRRSRRRSRTSMNTSGEAGKLRISGDSRAGPSSWSSSQASGLGSIFLSSPGFAPSPKRLAAIAVSIFISRVPCVARTIRSLLNAAFRYWLTRARAHMPCGPRFLRIRS